MKILLVGAALVVGSAAVEPIGKALAPQVVGGAVPTDLRSLAGYLALSGSGGKAGADEIGPISPSDPTHAGALRELTALSFGIGLAVAALSYAVLVRVLK